MTAPSSPPTNSTAPTIQRRARTAFSSAIILMVASFIMAANQTRIALQVSHWQTYADIVVILLFFASTIYSAVLIRKGHVDKGAKLLIWAFILDMIFRNALTAGLGIYFAIGASLIPPFIAITTLEPKEFNRTQIYSLFAGTLILGFDFFAPPYRQSVENLKNMAPAIALAVGLVSLLILLGILREHRNLLLSSKISIAAVFAVVIPIIILRIVGGISLGKSLEKQQKQMLVSQTQIVSNALDNFIEANLDDIRVEGQNPTFAAYLDVGNSQNFDERREPALDTLQSLRYKDLAFIDSYALINIWGIDVLDTNSASIGNNEYGEEYFREPMKNGLPYVSDPKYQNDTHETYLYFSAPVRSKDNRIVGVIRVRYNAYILQTLINEYANIAGEGSFASIFNEVPISDTETAFILIATGKTPSLRLHSITPLDAQAIDVLRRQGILPPGTTESLVETFAGLDEGLREIDTQPVFLIDANETTERGEKNKNIIATTTMEKRPWIVTVTQSEDIFLAPLNAQQRNTTLVSSLLILLSAIAASWGAQKLLAPLGRLQQAAEEVAAGNLETQVPVETSDEIGIFAEIFNQMTRQLRDLISSLETHVAERTEELERRARQLQTAAEVGSAAASMRDLNALLFQTTRLISERFGFYHVGIFLLDAQREYAVLQAANSPGGRRMLARRHKLKVGEVGIVGYATGHGEARIALDVGEDAVFFNNPDLPETRSEMALPLIAGGEVVGALDIQSKEPAAFKQADIETLQVLADQIAIAIENARLFTENQQSLEALRRAYGEISREAWKSILQQEARRYIGTSKGVTIENTSEDSWDASMREALREGKIFVQDDTLIVPLIVREQTIGALRLKKPNNGYTWKEEEIATVRILTEELSAALEGARLYNEATRRAVIERAISEITAKITESIRMETIMRTTAKELGKLLDDADVIVQLTEEEKGAS